jgi:molybdopterin synthase catalytic subunit
MFRLTASPIVSVEVANAVSNPEAGAVIVFEGVTRNHHDGKSVERLEYEAYGGMAEREMAQIGSRIADRWPGVRVAMVHRLGVVAVGEASVVIAVSAPHRGEAYAASRFAIDELKAHVPVWKKEVYADGSVWKANAEVTQ